MLKKTLKAVCEAVWWYPFEIEEVNFKGNGLAGEDIGLLLTSLELKFHTIIKLNLFENKIGFKGAEYLSKALGVIPLQELNLGSNHLGDEAVYTILWGFVESANPIRLQTLVLSNNEIGWTTSFRKVVDQLCQLIKCDSLSTLDMSWNNLKGDLSRQIAMTMESLEMLQTINFAQNLLGASHDNSEPPIYAFTECLNKNKYLLDVNFSYNLIN